MMRRSFPLQSVLAPSSFTDFCAARSPEPARTTMIGDHCARRHIITCACSGVAFPRDFQDRVRNIFKRLFRCHPPSHLLFAMCPRAWNLCLFHLTCAPPSQIQCLRPYLSQAIPANASPLCSFPLSRSLAPTAPLHFFSHLDAVVALEIEPHLNTCFRHFMWVPLLLLLLCD
jgi:hypothetical protein